MKTSPLAPGTWFCVGYVYLLLREAMDVPDIDRFYSAEPPFVLERTGV